MTQQQQAIVTTLTQEICTTLQRYNDERESPSINPDDSDYLIRVTANKVTVLRRIRNELENLFSYPERQQP